MAVSVSKIVIFLAFCFLVPLSVQAAPPVFASGFVGTASSVPRVHAASIVETEDQLHVAWYAGSREGASDVSIWYSSFDYEAGRWSKDKKLFDRETVQKALGRYIKKLGNPVLGVDIKGNLWLYFVSVSAGGWSGSSINYSISSDEGETWSTPNRVITSPFFNVSTLVRTQPFNFPDGSIGLPIYHEFLGKFAELLRLSPEGRVLKKNRISWGMTTLQPSIVSTGVSTAEESLLALMRNGGNELEGVLSSRSEDNGKTWGPLKSTGLSSFDSSVAAIRDNANRLLLVFNNSKTNRNVLSLAVSTDFGKTWRVVHDFENSKEIHNEYSYPSLLQDKNDEYHLVYTWLRKRIKHVYFNEAWLQQKIREVGKRK